MTVSKPPAPPSWTALDGASHPTVQEALTHLSRQVPAQEADRLRALAQEFFRRAAWRYLEHHGKDELVGVLVAAQRLIDDKTPDDIRVRVFTLTADHRKWEASTSVVIATVSDRPFVYDSVSGYLVAAGCTIRATLHPVLGVERENGRALIGPPRDATNRESCLVFEIDRVSPERGAELAAGVEGVLAKVVPATTDYHAMLERVASLVDSLREEAATLPEQQEELGEAIAFLEWLQHKHFVCLGYREYDLVGTGDARALTVRAGTGLGILRDEAGSSVATPVPLQQLDPDLRSFLTEGPVLTVAKSNNNSVVHRRTRMDYIGIKRRNAQGEIIGEARLLGLFTAAALSSAASEIPILRRKLRTLLDRTGLPPGSHDYKLLVELFEGLPKDDLFLASVDELQTSIDAMAVADPDSTIRTVVRHDFRAGAVAVTVILPRDKYHVGVRHKVQALLAERFHGSVTDSKLVLGDAYTARLHFYLACDGGDTPDVPRSELEQAIARAIESWEDRLRAALHATYPAAEAEALGNAWADGLPEGYQELTKPAEAGADVQALHTAATDNQTVVRLHAPQSRADGTLTRLKLYTPDTRLVLSDVLPILEALGLRVIDEQPTEALAADGRACFIHNFGVADAASGQQLDVPAVQDRLPSAVLRILDGVAQSDSLNALVTRAGMTWREVTLLRTYLQYFRQLGTLLTPQYVNEVLVRHADICRAMLAYFTAKFRPDAATPPDAREQDTLPPLRDAVVAGIAAVESLDEDRILTAVLNLMDSTVRTNYFGDGGTRTHISMKVRSGDVLQMPDPRPLFEIFVSSPSMEGIHLRGGMIARGGLRWSDRPEDYRTEVLGLMKTQMTKNALIVPVGSKGGFIIRRPVADRAALATQLETEYQTFIRGLLDLTDNIVDGTVVRPADVVAYDGDDPYLVVAADKGTAHLSDTANTVAQAFGYWLSDAFASGGSAGYDHKKEGITARGAWESGKRHFRELGKDIQTEPFTVVAIGDMGGDVFGNGMLQSKATKLVAAFNHLHIFLDPDPDPAISWGERKRLFDLPRSSWTDYDPALLSAGGAVFDRRAKRIPLSPEVQQLLKVDAPELPGPDVVRAILRAPVEMLYNGGIGTYVKHSEESHADVGDKANDGVRVDAPEVRAQVVVEGGNLGFTQRGRIEMGQNGVRLNADAIDNSGGVDMSDHEVNLKILLAQAILDGELDAADRDTLLGEMTDTVSAHVLHNNYLQSLVLSQDERAAREQPGEFHAVLQTLTERGGLDRATEFLPEDADLEEREAAGGGLTRPELAVMLGYVKNWLTEVVLQSQLPDDPHLHQYVEAYFPPQVTRGYAGPIQRHRLRRELLAMLIANRVVNQAGITFVQRMTDEAEVEPVEAVWAYLVSNEIFRADDLRAELFSLDGTLPTAGQYQALRDLEELLEDVAQWVLQNIPPLTALSEVLTRFRSHAEATTEVLLGLYAQLEGADVEATRTAYREQGLSEAVVDQFVLLPVLRAVLDVLVIAERLDVPEGDVAFVYMHSAHLLRIPWLIENLQELSTEDRWERLALHGVQEEIQDCHRHVVYAVLRQRHPQEAAGEMLRRYLDARGRRINRYLATVAQMRGPGDLTLAVLNVITRQLRQV